MEDNTYYNLGKRDALAEVFMVIRNHNGDFKKALTELTEEYEKTDKENPHCNWMKTWLSNSS